MKAETVEQIVEAGEAMGLDISSHEEYSGRNMFGRTTSAVVYTRLRDFVAAVARAAVESDDPDRLIEDLAKIRTDELGMDMIVY
jgi:hypothetical protein